MSRTPSPTIVPRSGFGFGFGFRFWRGIPVGKRIRVCVSVSSGFDRGSHPRVPPWTLPMEPPHLKVHPPSVGIDPCRGKGKRFCGTWKDSGAGAADPPTGRTKQDRARRGTRASFGAPIPRKPTYPVGDVPPAFVRSTVVRAPCAGEDVPPGIAGEPSFQPDQLGGIHVMSRFG